MLLFKLISHCALYRPLYRVRQLLLLVIPNNTNSLWTENLLFYLKTGTILLEFNHNVAISTLQTLQQPTHSLTGTQLRYQ